MYCNPVVEFIIEYPVRDMTTILMSWAAPEEGSTGELEHFEVYRDNALIATLANDIYHYEDTITVGVEAEYYILSVYSDGCTAASETLVGVGYPNMVNELENCGDLVYPNPSNGSFSLNLGKGQWGVAVYDIMGRKVYESRMEGRSALDLGQCQKGLYFLKVTGDGKTLTTKIMIQ